MDLMMESLKFAKGIDPVAGAFTGTVFSDVYSLKQHGRILFVIYAGIGAVGTATLTVESCDNVTPSNFTAIPFWSRDTCYTNDDDGPVVRRAAAGFVTTAGSSRINLIEVDAKDAFQDRAYVRLKSVESAVGAVLAGVLAIAGGYPNRYARAVGGTVIV